jgi:hypothetical protein
MNTSITRFPFLAAALAACILACSVSRVSSAVSDPPPNCDGSRPGKDKPCLGTKDAGLTCEGRSQSDCQASIGLKNVQRFAIDVVVSNVRCKTSLAAAKSEQCAEQWNCYWDPSVRKCVSWSPVTDSNDMPVFVFMPAYSSVDCTAVGCNQ